MIKNITRDYKVLIVVVSFNQPDFVVGCLRSVFECQTDIPFKLVLIDNASTPVSLRLIRKGCEFIETKCVTDKQFELIELTNNTGFAGGNNVGYDLFLKDESYTHLCLLNSDTIATDFWLDRLLAHQKDAIGPVTNACGNEQTVGITYSPFFRGQYILKIATKFSETRNKFFNKVCEPTQFLGFFCTIFSRNLVIQTGKLDEIFGLGGFEDDDYCQRLINRGFAMWIARDVFIHHWGSASFSKLNQTKLTAHLKRNLKIFEKLHHKLWQPRDHLPSLSAQIDSNLLRRFESTHPDAKDSVELRELTRLYSSSTNPLAPLKLGSSILRAIRKLPLGSRLIYQTKTTLLEFKKLYLRVKYQVKNAFLLIGVMSFRFAMQFVSSKSRSKAFLVDDFKAGGLEQVVVNIANQLHESGRKTLILVVSGEIGPIAKQLDSQINVVHLGNSRLNLLLELCRHKITHVSIHHSLFGWRLMRMAKIKMAYTIHNAYIWSDNASFHERFNLLNKYKILKIAVSQFVKDYVLTRTNVAPDSIIVINNGIALNSKFLQYSEGEAPTNINFVHPASYQHVKNQLCTIQAFESFLDTQKNPGRFKLICAYSKGAPDLRPLVIEKISQSRFASSFELREDMSHSEFIELLSSECNVVVLPSFVEGCSNVVLEAIGLGKPLILTDVGNAAEVLSQLGTGVLVSRLIDLHELDLGTIRTLATQTVPWHSPELVEAFGTIVSRYQEYEYAYTINRERIRNLISNEAMLEKYEKNFFSK